VITVTIPDENVLDVSADILVVGAFENEDACVLTSSAVAVDEAMTAGLLSFLHATGFEAKIGKVSLLPTGGAIAVPLVAVVGLGKEDDFTAETLRRVSGIVASATEKHQVVASALAVVLPDDAAAATRAMTEGFLLGSYKYEVYKTDSTGNKTETLRLIGGDAAGLHDGLLRAKGTILARDLANQPAGDLFPAALAERAHAAAESGGLHCEVWDLPKIKSEKLGGIESVGRGSEQPPRLIKMVYVPEDTPSGTLALVGKGITFDSGGLSLKTPDGMITMKTDMSGAAAVIGVMSVVADLAPSCKVTAYVASAENMPSGKAIRPGDVLTARNGKTIEVLNTDAEGRLVLADALSLAAEENPDAIIDLATLTGACMVALGENYAGLFSNNEDLVAALETASEVSGEHLWQLPLVKEYRSQLDSDIADVKNVGKRYGGAITAALFLQEFVGDARWAHIDIAGPARVDGGDGYITKGASGFGVRIVLDLIKNFSLSQV